MAVPFLEASITASRSATPSSIRPSMSYSRLAYSEVHLDEKAVTVTGFWRRARAFFASYGIIVDRVRH